MNKDLIFIEQHKKACGEDTAKKMLEELKKKQPDRKNAKKVYISVYGGEVHVNGPVAVPLHKPETLAEKIARFDRLAEHVAAQRQLMMSIAQDVFGEDDEDVMAEKEMEEVETVDEFGDKTIVFSQPKMNFAKQEDSAEGATTDTGGQSQVIEGDEPSQTTDPAEPSGMPSQE